MSNFPYMQFYPADWKTDSDLRKCSLSSRGFWIEMLGSMHLDNRSGEISGTFSELSQLAGCSPEEAEKAIKELYEKQAANVTLPLQNVTCNEKVTIINRRMKNEHKKRNGSTLRVRKHREQQDCNATVTVHSSEVIVQKTENTESAGTDVLSDFFEVYEMKHGKLHQRQKDGIRLDLMHIPEDLRAQAIQQSIKYGQKTIHDPRKFTGEKNGKIIKHDPKHLNPIEPGTGNDDINI